MTRQRRKQAEHPWLGDNGGPGSVGEQDVEQWHHLISPCGRASVLLFGVLGTEVCLSILEVLESSWNTGLSEFKFIAAIHGEA